MLVIMVSGAGTVMKYLVPDNASVDGALFRDKVLKGCALAYTALLRSKEIPEQQRIKQATAEGIRRAKEVISTLSSLVPIQTGNISDSIMVSYKYSEHEDDNYEDLHNTNDITVKYGHPRKTKEKATEMLTELGAVLRPHQSTVSTAAEPGSAIIHYGNAPCHNCRICSEELSQTPFVRLPHPPYSPDIAVCDFFLFGKLKHYLQQVAVSDRQDLESEIDRILNQISSEEWKRVFTEWLKRLRWIVDNNGDYYREESGGSEKKLNRDKMECNQKAPTICFITPQPDRETTSTIKSTPAAISHTPSQVQPNTSPPSTPLQTKQTLLYKSSINTVLPRYDSITSFPAIMTLTPTKSISITTPSEFPSKSSFPLDTPLKPSLPFTVVRSSLNTVKRVSIPERRHTPSHEGTLTSESNLGIITSTPKHLEAFTSSRSDEENIQPFPQSMKPQYFKEDKLKDGKRIYRCSYITCGYYSDRKSNVTRHYSRNHFFHCRYPKCSFSTEFRNDFLKHFWTHNSEFASSNQTNSQTST